MPTITKYAHGELSWVDLATTDSDAAKRFYGSLFGWTFEDMPAGPGMTYSMAQLGGQTVAALYRKGPDMAAAPPAWLSYVTVDDIDARVKKVTASGGTVHKEPFDVMGVGRMAVVEDPTGGVLAFWQPIQHIGATIKNEPGALCWHELFTTDVDRAGKFYVQAIDWKARAIDMGPMGTYTLLARDDTKGTEVAGMTAMPPAMKGAPSHWLAYFLVASCDASAKKVGELGGTTMMPPTDIPNMGRYSIHQDPQGATFALFESVSAS